MSSISIQPCNCNFCNKKMCKRIYSLKAACIKKYQKIKSTSKVKFISLHSISNKHTQKSSKQKALMLTRKSSNHKLI